MKKVFFILSMAFAAVTVMTSCSDKEVTRESFIGKWNADYKWEPINGSAPTNPFEGVTITFTINADGTYDENWSDGTHEQSTWSYDETTGDFFFHHTHWTVEKCTSKQINLYYDKDSQYTGYSERMTLRKTK